MSTFDLENFEYLCYRRQREEGARDLLQLLRGLDSEYGVLNQNFSAGPLTALLEQEFDAHFLTRIASAATALLSDPELFFSQEHQNELFGLQRWLAAIFAASPFGNADHILRSLNMAGAQQRDEITLATENVLKFCLLYHPNSEIRLDLDALWEFDRRLAASLCVSLLSPRFLGTEAAHGKREAILPWLTTKLPEFEDLDLLPLGVLHDVYMHCSYADRADKHDVKRSIATLIRRKLKSLGFADCARAPELPDSSDKPVLLVVLEWFTSGHSIYRTHSRTMEAARRHFHVVAMGFERCVDDVTRQVFDEFVPIDDASIADQLRQIQNFADARGAQIAYMPSVGMFPLTMFLATLRIAPLQCMALGHPATTHSPAIDYVVVEEDYVGDPACFSEKLLLLPFDGMPYRPSAHAVPLPKRAPRGDRREIDVAVCATTMKLNPGFLATCAEIAHRSQEKVHFHFLIGQAQGLTYPQVKRTATRFLGDAVTVYPHQPYPDYMKTIARCDLFLNPFPFGNTNGIIDAVSAGLVGVCLTGPEVHEHIDEGLFARLGMPDWLVARDRAAYVAASLRLIANHEERKDLEGWFSGSQATEKLFTGRPEILGERFLRLIAEASDPLLLDVPIAADSTADVTG